jgi:hypothetical protein
LVAQFRARRSELQQSSGETGIVSPSPRFFSIVSSFVIVLER